jgi:ATP-binding protein involved in chromosome partitioning
MFKKVGVPLLGVVENMSIHVCTNCGHEEAIFGEGGGLKLARDYEVEVIGRLPLDLAIREQTDSGFPVVASNPESAAAAALEESATAAPKITITDD